jgi:formate hydrogenlyase transcriptional activator
MKIAEHAIDLASLQELVDSVPALIHTANPDGAIDFFNLRWLEFVGLPLEDLEGWKWTAAVHPDDVSALVSKWRACLASGDPFELESRVRRADGAYRWMLHQKLPLRSSSGEIVKWYGSSVDIDDRKRADEKRTEAEFYLAEGQRLGHSGSWAFNAAGFDYWSPELFAIHGLAPGGQAPTIAEYMALVHPEDRGFVAQVIQKVLSDYRGFDFTKRIVRPDGDVRYVRCVGAPVIDGGRPHTVVGTAIDVTEHELLTRELRRREAYLAEAQRLSRTGSFGWKPESGEIVWSDETYRIFEYDSTLKPTLDLVVQRMHPEDRALTQEVIERASQTGADFEHETRLLLTDGRVKHIHAIAHAAESPSGDREFIGAVTDITERKTTEERIRRLVDAGMLGIFFATVEGEIVEANRAFLEMLQYSRQDLVSGRLRWADLTPAEWRERDERALAEFLVTGVFQYEKEYFRKDGSRVPVLVGGARFRSANEGVVYVLDLSEQKRAEEKIREQEMEFRQALDFTPQLIGVIGTDGTPLYANRASLDYLGMSLDEWRQRSAIGEEVHPDDMERLIAEGNRASSTASAYELEVRVRKGDGSFRWFLSRFNPLLDDKGQVKRWYIASTDIEDRKRAEEKLQQENVALREEIDRASMFEEIVGSAPALASVLSRVSKVARSDSTVLITGETGTGKELVARAVHRRSSRSSRAFVSVNCAAIPRDLIASELFGHEKGAFTGALQRRLGRFELADGGTIFLDEVGELSPDTQVALLRVLQEREFERVGGRQTLHVDVRVIAATNRDLSAAVDSGMFRQDLFYRLNVFPIAVPPLRERADDIPLLVEYFIDRYARKAGKTIRHVNKRTLDRLQSYPWPGNVRELQNVIERSVIVCDTDEFMVDDSWLSAGPAVESRLALSSTVAAHEKATIEEALRASGGRVFGPSGAAARLGIARSTLESKIRALGINKNRFRGRLAKPL